MKSILHKLVVRQEALACEMEEAFEQFFASAQVPDFNEQDSRPSEDITSLLIASPGCTTEDVNARIKMLPAARGLYVILTDFEVKGMNSCRFRVGESQQKAIYRGHSSNIRERVMGHLMNSSYLEYCRSLKNKKPWGGYLKIDDNQQGDGGIDISSDPYRSYSWGVVAYRMDNTSRQIRELAENGFSAAFGLPARSSKEPNTPRRTQNKVFA